MHTQTHPEAEERERAAEQPAVTAVYPCDQAIRSRILQELELGLTLGELARGSGVNRSIVSQYLSAQGNTYPGTISLYERRMVQWLDKRSLEFLAGIPTIETSVAKQIEALARAVRRQRIMGKAIGGAGIGKTRGAAWLAEKDTSICAYYVSGQTGTKEAVRSALFYLFGIRGGKQTYGVRNLDKYRELVKRVRGKDVVFLFDQAHMLSLPAMHFLCELWNETRRGQLWLGTETLLEKLERDEQLASRVEFGDRLRPQEPGDEKRNARREIVTHQIKSLLPDLNGELAALVKLCERLAGEEGRFRRVEMRLGNVLYLSEKAALKGKSWAELFELAAENDNQFA